MSSNKSEQVQVSKSRERFFKMILIVIPILLLGILELGLQLGNYGGNPDLFIPFNNGYGDYLKCNPDVGRRYFVSQKTVPTPSHDLILQEKPENGFRIFVMGGSTTAGFPYGGNLMFSRILHFQLQELLPMRRVEVMNVAMSAINSYTLVDFTDEILAHEPDLILIYAGHNEYYGALGCASMETIGGNPKWVRGLLKLRKYKTFLLMRDGYANLRKMMAGSAQSSKSNPHATLMERMIREQEIPYQSKLFQRGVRQYHENLELIIQRIKDTECPVLISELVSNIRDQKPFIAADSEAISVYREAVQAESNGDYVLAHSLYTKAKDLDQLRFRAPDEINGIIHDLGKKYDTPVIPMHQVFKNEADNGLVGDALMTDHLHPNIDGYFLMARAFLDSIVPVSPAMQDEYETYLSKTKQEWGITRLDTLYEWLTLRYLKSGWPFRETSGHQKLIRSFRPRSFEDTLAGQVVFYNRLNLQQAHFELAEYFEKRGEYPAAFREYHALIHHVPHELMFYEKAAEMLLKTQLYSDAIYWLKRSTYFGVTQKTTRLLGQLYLQSGKTADAIRYLEKSKSLDAGNTQLLYLLGQAYIIHQNPEKADEQMKIIRQIDPGYLNERRLNAIRQMKVRYAQKSS